MDHSAHPATYADLCDAARRRVKTISAASLRAGKTGSILLIDVREPNESEDGVVPGALLIPRGTRESEIAVQLRLVVRGVLDLMAKRLGASAGLGFSTISEMRIRPSASKLPAQMP